MSSRSKTRQSNSSCEINTCNFTGVDVIAVVDVAVRLQNESVVIVCIKNLSDGSICRPIKTDRFAKNRPIKIRLTWQNVQGPVFPHVLRLDRPVELCRLGFVGRELLPLGVQLLWVPRVAFHEGLRVENHGHENDDLKQKNYEAVAGLSCPQWTRARAHKSMSDRRNSSRFNLTNTHEVMDVNLWSHIITNKTKKMTIFLK